MKTKHEKIVEILKQRLSNLLNALHVPITEQNKEVVHRLIELSATDIAHLYSAGEEVDRIETDLLDAINSGLRKWDYKKKLSSEDALELLFCLQDRIMDVKLTRPTVSEEE